ncbi:unnamed protein product [Pleuronectes platessa]|uniref:Uncharacterized protein n=1 Tax=Pleuronectes platessa TaxID=8262 RepID=A0A9N7Y9I1_PLEPL|nr:unnamed protein product [Pleuronectes platessa]
MSGQERFAREQVLEQLFSQQQSSYPKEDSQEQDREMDGELDQVMTEMTMATTKMTTLTKTTTHWVMLLQICHPWRKNSKKKKTTAPTTGLVERETFLSRNKEIAWSSRAYDPSSSSAAGQSTAAKAIVFPPGPTMHATSRTGDLALTFHLFIKATVENIILEMTNQRLERDGQDRPARLRLSGPVGRQKRPGDILCHDAPKSHGQIGRLVRGLGRLGGAPVTALQPGARSDRGRATGSVQRESHYMALDERANASRARPARLAREITLAGEPGSLALARCCYPAVLGSRGSRSQAHRGLGGRGTQNRSI